MEEVTSGTLNPMNGIPSFEDTPTGGKRKREDLSDKITSGHVDDPSRKRKRKRTRKKKNEGITVFSSPSFIPNTDGNCIDGDVAETHEAVDYPATVVPSEATTSQPISSGQVEEQAVKRDSKKSKKRSKGKLLFSYLSGKILSTEIFSGSKKDTDENDKTTEVTTEKSKTKKFKHKSPSLKSSEVDLKTEDSADSKLFPISASSELYVNHILANDTVSNEVDRGVKAKQKPKDIVKETSQLTEGEEIAAPTSDHPKKKKRRHQDSEGESGVVAIDNSASTEKKKKGKEKEVSISLVLFADPSSDEGLTESARKGSFGLISSPNFHIDPRHI